MDRQGPEADGSTDNDDVLLFAAAAHKSCGSIVSCKFRNPATASRSHTLQLSDTTSTVPKSIEMHSHCHDKPRRRLTSVTDVQINWSFEEEDRVTSPSSVGVCFNSPIKHEEDFERGYHTDPCNFTVRPNYHDDHATRDRVFVFEDEPIESSESTEESYDDYALEQLLAKGTGLEQMEGVGSALSLYDRAVKEGLVEEALNIAYLDYKMGVLQWKCASYEKSLISLRRAIKAFESEGGLRVRLMAEIYFATGRTLASLGEQKRARKYFMRALRTLEYDEFVDNIVPSENLELRGKILTQVASLLISHGSYEMASNVLGEAITLQRQVLGPQHADVASTLLVYGSLNEALHQHEYAAKCYLDALEIFRNKTSTSAYAYVDMSVALSNVGWLFYLSQDYDNALHSYEEALELAIPILGEEHRNVASLRVQIGMVYAQQGRLRKALKAYRQSLEIQRALLGDEHDDVALTLAQVGFVYKEMGNFTKAVEFSEHALTVRKSNSGRNSVIVGSSCAQLGRLYMDMEENLRASICFSNALAAYHENGLLVDDPRVIEARDCLAQIQSPST